MFLSAQVRPAMARGLAKKHDKTHKHAETEAKKHDKLPSTARIHGWQLRTRIPGPHDEPIHPPISHGGVSVTEWTVVYAAVKQLAQHDPESTQFLRVLWASSFSPMLSRLHAFLGRHGDTDNACAEFLFRKTLFKAFDASAKYRFAAPLNDSETYKRTIVDYLWSRINWL